MSDEHLLLPAPDQPKLLPPPKRAGGGGDPRRRRRIVLIVVAVVAALLLIGWFLHHRKAAEAREASERARDRLPSVSTIAVKASPPTSDLRLPGTISPLTEASLFARASGYLKARYVDIGDTVVRGQVMAEIDAPDLDQQVAGARQQLDAARSAVNDAKARVDLSKVTYDRLATLVKDQAVSQQQVDQSKQDLDTANAGLATSRSNVGASQASLERLVVLQRYEKLRAPFDGIVTARSVDVGSLVNSAGATSGQSGVPGVSTAPASSSSGSGTSGGSTTTSSSNSGGEAQAASGQATELFRVAQADRVRVFVTVPQENAAALAPDNDASVFVEGYDAPFEGRVTRTARALDPSARTMLVEVQVPNPKRLLVPGMYAQVRFRSPRVGTPLLVPGEAVIARADGLSVAVVEALRPEDRQRLPKHEPSKADQKNKGADGSGKKDGKKGDKSGGKSDAAGDSKKGEKDDDRSQADAGGDADAADDDDPNHAKRIHLQKVQVGRDYGTEIEITSGLSAGTTIVANPGDDVAEGALVIPQAQKAAPGGDGKSADQAQGAGGSQPLDAPPEGNQSPSMAAPTKARK